ncbi:hypothetical protein JHK82_015342 [Glycine max]|nr:hypothetical protein GLYMA_06G151100v4 [Glycine max]KAG5019412.1 hypothetical protein JHK87_015267 [Glycine soja]KAG5031745.1 hypothetical protein JHK85_015727 [Glycine max]KAG5045961.1 hypothetical protein JHK86_015367 [Glycine max]KAG5148461.1 hypothetical protein JHK82_015342 [Glycine max]
MPFPPHFPQNIVIVTPKNFISSLHSSPLCYIMLALRSRRHKTLLLLLILFLCILGHGHGSRTTNVFKLKPKSQHTGHFFGFLPKRIHIPFSSPSKKHNDIGLQSLRSP